MRATGMEVLDVEIHSTYVEKVKLLSSRLALYFVRTVVIREISSRKLATVLLTAPGIAGHRPLRVPIVREREKKLDPIFVCSRNYLVEPLQTVLAFVNGCLAVC